MSVLFQIAGKCRAGMVEQLAAGFVPLRAAAAGQPGFERAALLVNRSTLQFQVLLYWTQFEAGLAFHREHYPRASRSIAPMVEAQGTLVTSQLAMEIGRAPETEAA